MHLIRCSPAAGAFLDGVVAASLALMGVVTLELARSSLTALERNVGTSESIAEAHEYDVRVVARRDVRSEVEQPVAPLVRA